MYYIFPLLILVLSTIVFHIFLIRKYPQDKLFWKRVDYGWVTLGIIGLLGSSISFQNTRSENFERLHQNMLIGVYDQLIRDTERMPLELHNYRLLLQYQDTVKTNLVKCDSLIRILSKLNSQLLIYRDTIEKQTLITFFDSITRPYNLFLFTNSFKQLNDKGVTVSFMLSRVKEELDEVKKYKSERVNGEFYFLMLYISPYLVAIAIAIRLTKITVEIEEIK